jgi:hypothetical protein
MNTHADRTQENKSQSVANAVSQKKSSGESTFQFVDNRPEVVTQRKLQEVANSYSQNQPIQRMMRRNFTAPAATKFLGPGPNFRADKRSPEALARRGGMQPWHTAETIPRWRIPIYVMFNITNPGVISTAKSKAAAVNFATAEKARNNDSSPWYIYQIDTTDLVAIDREEALPAWFRKLWKSEDEEMIKDKIPEDKLTLVETVNFKAPSSGK